ncbi:FeoB-associated Cys-rich membrane protein [Paenimyroides baculatum]|nr:FeoB-associated Cys-rich membrane protein [Paenimyroides baculatum]
MDVCSVGVYDSRSVCCSVNCLSTFKIKRMQDVIVYILLCMAVAFLLKKFVFKKKKKGSCGNDNNCGCG